MGSLTCKKKKKICIGDLKHRITLQLRSLTAPTDVKFTETYTDIGDLWAYVETVDPEFTFSKTNIDESITHRIFIRYRTDITIDNWILFENIRYNVASFKDPDFSKTFLQLNCNLKGNKSEESSKAVRS